MKIVFVNDTFLVGRGSDTVVYELARRLGKKHEVYVIGSSSNFREENFTFIKAPIERFKEGSVRDFFLPLKVRKLRNFIREFVMRNKPDVINVHHASINLILEETDHLRSMFFTTFHGFPPSPIKISKFFRLFGRKIISELSISKMKMNRKIISPSSFLKRELEKKGISSGKIEVIPNGVSEEFRSKNPIDGNFMLFVGRHEWHKRVDELIKISKEIDFPLVISGYGSLTKKLMKYKNKINATKVKFVGKVDRERLIELYQKCAFFISASRWEGFGLIFLEAAASRKPSVAYKVGSIPEVVKHGKTGLLAEDYQELRGYANLLATDRKLRKKLGGNAFSFSKKFTWKETIRKYECLFESA